MVSVAACGKSDVGLRRSNNEDSFIVKPDLGFFAVADGMGGAAYGEVASKTFIDTSFEVFSRIREPSEQSIYESIREIFSLTNKRIFDYAGRDTQYEGMGCTAELLALYHNSYFVGHVGDSRTYLYRDGTLRQITRDHSLVQNQIDRGLLTPAEAKNSSRKNVILRAVGIAETLAVDLIRGKILNGDIFLLCSDGLTDMADDDSIQGVLSLRIALDQKGEKLIQLAKSAGGYDNITVILCEVSA